jgi:hypothetical protein
MRSSEQQLKDELDQMYKTLTDPEEIQKRKVIRQRETQVKEQKEDYGIE